MFTSLHEVALNAMVAHASQPGNEAIFKSSHLQEWEESAVFGLLLKRLGRYEAIERLKYAQYASKHMSTLAYHVFGSQGLEGLHVLKEELRVTAGSWPYQHTLTEFSKWYWHLVLKKRIEEGDYRRAWDDIRKSKREEKPFRLPAQEVEQKLKDLFHAMGKKGVVSREWHSGMHHYRHNTPMAGMPFLVEMYPRRRQEMAGSRTQPRMIMAGSYELTYHEHIILTLAQHFAKQRKVKRARKAARKVAA